MGIQLQYTLFGSAEQLCDTEENFRESFTQYE